MGENRFNERDGNGQAAHAVTAEVAYLRTIMVNVAFVGAAGAGDGGWVLVDAGLHGTAGRILDAARARYGDARPAAIVLTHGHFDHVGALQELAAFWDVPVYAHELEMPYLTGRSDYPPPDPTVGGGAMALLSPLYPKHGIDLGDRVATLPADGSVPGAPGWRWIHTPGHTPGHVSLFRDDDRTLMAGDAFVTTKQESAIAVLMQRQEVHGPPMYFTPDWSSARRSVERLAALRPAVAATGHGIPMRGDALDRELGRLAREFEALAMPAQGRYLRAPARADASGVIWVPPATPFPTSTLLLGLGAALVAGFAIASLTGRRAEG